MESNNREDYTNDSSCIVEDEVEDDDVYYPPFFQKQTQEIVDGLNLNELVDGKPVTFSFNKDFKQTFEDEDDEEGEELDYERTFDPDYKENKDYKVKENIEIPFLNESFESLASKMTNVTDDGCVKKEIISNGIGPVIPETCEVTVHYNLYKKTQQEPFDSTCLRKRPEEMNLGAGETLPGIEIAIQTMKKKEHSRFFIKWNYAFGKLGCPDRIEPECDIIADIKLIDFQDVDVDGDGLLKGHVTEFEKTIARIKSEQCDGSNAFKQGETKKAIFKYKKSVRMLNSLKYGNAEEEVIGEDLKVKSFVNLAVCYNNLGSSELACSMCQEALSIEPDNTKALFHYGRASIALSNFSRAQKLLTRLMKMCPNNKDIANELNKLDEKKQLYEMKDRRFWKNAFQTVDQETQHKQKEMKSNNFNGGFKGNVEKAVAPEYYEEELCKKLSREMSLTEEHSDNRNEQEEN